ncbi:aldo/keto reductase [Paenibacillus eucommiae]|uniref:Aryl-alcohol dehydrogenase-like predicted oxidoreductase n=1 Tax=Paenibacillus eucommiae TaxID=1355755 RepID=A0ABS4IPD8_9BACL|nr:aldo/keto reductase [Paenibacillus eucommiae]MBP1989427.1 aryl-alcohol dehydrogenase-like predicted oxidoreductase [Paenibacillus eucommiae]
MVESITTYSSVNGLTLSKLMLGTAQLGLAGYGVNNRAEVVDAEAILAYCQNKGINCYDTAHIYGDAEVKIGQFFQGKETPFIASKLKIDLNLTSLDEVERQMIAKTESILERLQIKSLPALLLHEPYTLVAYGEKVIQVLNKMKRDGLIQRGGLSLDADSGEHYQECADLIKDDVIELIQAPMNLFDHRLVHCGALEDFKKEHKIVVIRSVFLQGLFFHDRQTLPENLRPDGSAMLKKLDDIALSEGISLAQLAVSYIRDLEGVHSLVIGAENAQQIANNLDLLAGPSISERTRELIDQTFKEVPKLLVTPAMWK